MALLALGMVGCSTTDPTVSSLIDLLSSTTGNFVQIIVKAVVDGLLSFGPATLDLSAPISTQNH
jgi:hypothetical protein